MDKSEWSVVVYKATNKINGKVYIGITNDFKRRVARHKADSKKIIESKHPKHFARALNFHKFDNFNWELLTKPIPRCLSKSMERFFIRETQSNNRDFGYNLTDGGDGTDGFHMSEDAKLKLSLALKGKKKSHPVSEETREKLRIASTGRKIPKEAIARGVAKRIGKNTKNTHYAYVDMPEIEEIAYDYEFGELTLRQIGPKYGYKWATLRKHLRWHLGDTKYEEISARNRWKKPRGLRGPKVNPDGSPWVYASKYYHYKPIDQKPVLQYLSNTENDI
jgi:group I intron endonuclease